MSAIQILLKRPATYKGLGLIALTSALITPLALEVIYNHSELWFKGLWQDQAFINVWVIWTYFGVLTAVPWGIDRGFLGITPRLHYDYSLVLSLIGVAIYILFGLPSWVWLIQMSLVGFGDMMSCVGLSALILLVSAVLATLIDSRAKYSMFALVVGNLIGMLALYCAWNYLSQGTF